METTKEMLDKLKSVGFEIVKHPERDLYIVYNERELFRVGGRYSGIWSIGYLKDEFSGPPQEKHKGCNITNQEALTRISKLESALKELLKPGKLEELFPVLPLTKAGKFHKSAAINLYIPGIKYTTTEEYFSQTEVALQLATYGPRWSDGAVWPDIAIVRINAYASFVERKTPPNLIDTKGNIFAPTEVPKKNKHFKLEELVPGTSYLDRKGTEYLYLGQLQMHQVDDYYLDYDGVYYHTDCMGMSLPLCLRMSPKAKKEVSACTSLREFFQKRFDAAKDEYLLTGLKELFSNKFVEKGTVYFDEKHSKFHGLHVEKPLMGVPGGTMKCDIDLP